MIILIYLISLILMATSLPINTSHRPMCSQEFSSFEHAKLNLENSVKEEYLKAYNDANNCFWCHQIGGQIYCNEKYQREIQAGGLTLPDNWALDELKHFGIYNVPLMEIKKELFKEWPRLTYFSVSNGSLTDDGISDGVLDELGDVIHLSLNGNKLTKLNVKWLEKMPELRYLTLANNSWQCDCEMAKFWWLAIERNIVVRNFTCSNTSSIKDAQGRTFDQTNVTRIATLGKCSDAPPPKKTTTVKPKSATTVKVTNPYEFDDREDEEEGGGWDTFVIYFVLVIILIFIVTVGWIIYQKAEEASQSERSQSREKKSKRN